VPEQVTVQTQVEVPEIITEEVTEEVTEDETTEITEEVTELVTEQITEIVTEQVTEQVTEEVITQKPASLYIMFDQSASMGNLWSPAVTAVKSFINDTDSAGLGVGIQYFPISGGSCSDGAGYKTPDVAVATLPNNAKAITTSLGKHSASGIGTPIEGALRGVTQYCLQFQASRPDQQCVAVLVTDGEPELALGCERDYDKLAAIAAAAKSKGVITFAVGLKGANFTLLDKIRASPHARDRVRRDVRADHLLGRLEHRPAARLRHHRAGLIVSCNTRRGSFDLELERPVGVSPALRDIHAVDLLGRARLAERHLDEVHVVADCGEHDGPVFARARAA
jgi:hypothetical protein